MTGATWPALLAAGASLPCSPLAIPHSATTSSGGLGLLVGTAAFVPLPVFLVAAAASFFLGFTEAFFFIVAGRPVSIDRQSQVSDTV